VLPSRIGNDAILSVAWVADFDNPLLDTSSGAIVETKSPDKLAAQNDRFRRGSILGESLLFTGGYIHSVSELRGWSDSDKFMAPYLGHPIEGSIFGFIERQNDRASAGPMGRRP
jgi:hypothetical protein